MRGLVEDAFTHELLQDVSVKAMHPDGTVLCVVQTKDYAKIYSEAYGGMTIPFDDQMTYYSLDLPEAGDYELRVSRIGYEPQTVKLHVPRKEYGKRVKVWRPAPIRLRKAANVLGEATVKASRIMMVMKGDTLVYNAAVFQLSEGSMLDQLVRQLPGVELRDDADPLAVWLGNATLKPTQRHSARLNYQRLSAKHSWNVGAGYNLQRRATGQAMDYNPATGAYTYQPRNIDGNWNASLDGGASGPLRNPKFRYSTSTQLRYANSVDFVSEAGANGQRSSVRNLSVGETLRFDYRYGQVHVGAQARASYTRATSRRADFATINCVDFDYGLTLTAPLVWDIELATDLTLFSRQGYDDASMNDNCLVWNASLSRSFGRKKDWTLRADGFDILRQLSSVRRTLTAQGRTETWYNTVPSYFMVRLMYRIHVLPKRDRKAD